MAHDTKPLKIKKRFVGQEITLLFPCYVIFSAIKNELETLNLFFTKYSADTKLPGNDIQLLSLIVLALLDIGDFHPIM